MHPREPDVDAQFARFQRTADPAALAAVFDATAPELLRVAAHLVLDAHAAEDLVQATFLVAIEQRHAWSGRGPVVGWLLAILTNRARRRFAARAPDLARLAANASPPPDPHASAAARETGAAIDDAIASLPEVYQPVLALHLRHGLSAAEIAAALRRPSGTVRTQIVRGLDLLRRALPGGLAVGAAAIAGPTAGLAAVRAHVLAAAGAAAAGAGAAGAATCGTAASTLLGGLLVQKVVLSLVAAIAAVAASVLVLPWLAWRAAAPPTPAPAPHPGSARAAAPSTAAPSTAALASDLAAGEVAARTVAPAAPSAPSAPRVVRVRGRCVDAHTGQPLAGCTFEARALGERPGLLGTVTSGPDGAFALAFPLPADGRAWLGVVDGARTARVSYGRRAFAPGPLDLGDVPVPHGCRVEGRLVDADGAPIAGEPLSLQLPQPALPEGWRCGGGTSCETDPRGGFSADGVPPGRVTASACPSLRLRANGFDVPGDLSVVRVELVAERAPAGDVLAGIVVDERGQPVRNARVTGPAAATASTRRDGSFRMVREARAGGPGSLYVVAEGFEPLATERRDDWFGRDDVKIVLRRDARLEVRVSDEQGRPVEEFAVRVFRDPLTSGRFGRDPREPRGRGRHPGGRATVANVRRGRNFVVVEPNDANAWGPQPPVVIDVADAGAVCRVTLRRPLELSVRVVAARGGEPIGGTAVQLVRAMRDLPLTLATRVVPPDYQRLNQSSMRPDDPRLAEHSEAIALASATTDAEGRCTLVAPPGGRLALRVLGPGHVPALVAVPSLGVPVRVEVVRGASIRGEVAPLAFVRRLHGLEPPPPGGLQLSNPGLRFVDAHGAQRAFPAHERAQLPLPADGRFRCDGVPPGDWDVHVVWSRRLGMVALEDSTVVARAHGLADGEAREVNVDLTALRPATLRGRLLLDGAPAAGAKAVLQLVGVDGAPGGAMPLAVDGEGRYACEVLPGGLRVAVQLQQAGWQTPRLVASDVLRVGPGERAERDVLLVRRRVTVRVVGSDGAPRAGVSLTVPEAGGIAPGYSVTTGADGTATIDPAPASPFTVRCGDVELGPIDPAATGVVDLVDRT